MLGKKFTRAKGFSLLEMIVYIAILSILLVGVIDLALIIKQSQQKFTANRKVSTDLGNALETIKFLTQSATALPVDNAGKLCEDFHGSQGYNTYYLSLYYNTSSAAVALPYECRGDYNATTTAVKIYWKSSSDRGLWIDCYRGFINGNSGNCTTIQNTGDSSFMLTSAKNTVVYDGGLSFSTTTAYGTSALNISLTMGIPNADHPNYANATTTASTTAVFRVKLADTPAPTEVVCGDGARGSGEVCDSTLTTACALDSTYYKGGYVEDGSTCSGKTACNSSCTACLSAASCDGSSCGGYSSGGKCWYLGAAGQTCNTVCTGHGSCVAGNSFDDASCTVLTHLGADCSNGCNIGSNFYNPHWDGATPGQCAYSGTLTERCTASVAGVQRLCACTT